MNRVHSLRAVIFFLALGGTAAARGQTQLEASVAGAGGTASACGEFHLSATLGQAVVGTIKAADPAFFQGFLHPRAAKESPGHPVLSDPSAPGLLILSCTPNPVTGPALLSYFLPGSGPVRLELYDAIGRRVRTLIDGERAAGLGTVTADPTGLPSGNYLILLSAGGERAAATLRLID